MGLLVLSLWLTPAASAQPQTGEPTTFCTPLHAGANLVSLPVVPDDPRLGILLADVLPHLVLVQDEGGRHFVPAQGIYDLETWDWDETYKVVLRSDAELCAHGSEIVPESSPIALDEGPNWVSYLHRQERTVEEAFASILPTVTRVEDGAGRVYAPGHSSSLATLEAGNGYKVWASQPSSLVYPANPAPGGGSTPNPEPEPVAAHWPQAVPDHAMATADSLDLGPYCEGDAPLAFSLPNAVAGVEVTSAGVLTATTAGAHAVTVRCANAAGSADATFALAVTESDPEPEPGPSGGADYQAATIGEALSLTGLKAGDTVEVLGYYAPGDGGGGTFLVTESSATPDGGTVFVPAEHQSSFLTEEWKTYQWRYAHMLGLTPSTEDVVYGSVSAEMLHPTTGEVIFAADGRDLHGHEHVSQYHAVPYLDYEDRRWRDARKRFAHRCNDVTGNQDSCTIRLRYRHTTSPLRLERQGVGSTLVAEWFGARTHRDDPAFDNQPVLNHMVNVAKRMNADVPGTITTVLFSNPTVYEYWGSTQLADGLTLRGAGGTELVTVTNDLGHTYSPVRVKSAHTRLRVKAGKALDYIRSSSTKRILNTAPSTINLAPGVMRAGLEDIVLDGNWENNVQGFEEGWLSFDNRELYMRNTPGYTGFTSTVHGGVDIPIGQEVTVRNAAVMGYGGTDLLGHANSVWTLENVRTGNNVWNHSLYQVGGDIRNLTIEGFSWTHFIFTWGKVRNLVYEDGAPAPYREGAELVNYRGADTYSVDDRGTGQVMRTDGTWAPLGNIIDGFYADFRGSAIHTFSAGLGPAIHLRNGTIVSSENENAVLFRESGNGYQKALYGGYEFEDVTLYTAGGAKITRDVVDTASLDRALIRGITVGSLASGSAAAALHDLRVRRRDHSSWDRPEIVNHFSKVGGPFQRVFFLGTTLQNDAPRHLYFVTDSRIENTSNPYKGPTGQGKLDGLDGTLDGVVNADTSLLAFYFEDVEMNVHTDYGSNLQVMVALGRYRNTTDILTGMGSEAEGTVDHTAAGGETYVDVDPNLWWVPYREEFVTYSGADAGLVSSVSPVCPTGNDAFGIATGNSDIRKGCALRFTLNRALSAGERLTFDWSAAIHPWESGVVVPDFAGGTP